MTHAFTRPLERFTIVDLGGTVATAVCGRFFADFGARVIDVEPAGGFATRRLPPFAPEGDGGASGLHALLSPGKESAIAESEADVLRWAAGADVVLDFAPSRVAWGRLREAAPHAVVGALSWHGLTGPLAEQPGNDATLCAQIGLVKTIGEPGETPILPSGTPISVLGGAAAFAALVAELLGRELGRPRDGVLVDVSLLEVAMCLTEVAPISFFNGGAALARLGRNLFPPNYPSTIFASQDGWVGVTALTPKQWRDLCHLLGLQGLTQEPRIQAGLVRIAEARSLGKILDPVFLTRTSAEWVRAGQALRIPIAPVPTLAELLGSAQLAARHAFRDLALPGGKTVRVPGPPFTLSGSPPPAQTSVPALGVCGAPPKPRENASPAPAPGVRTPLREPERRPALLRGLRVLDLTMGWAGPLAARHAADLGAEVIKIESRQRLDWWRGWEVSEAFLRERVFEKSPAYNMVNRNKLGMTLDLTAAAGAALFRRLVAEADAVIENFSAGVMEKLGFGDDALWAINPRLAIVTMPPFGRGGPQHDYRAYGSTVEQASGLPMLNGAEGDPPTMLHVALGDPVAGVHGGAGLVLALLHARRSGEGQLVDLSQTEALTTLGVHGLAHQLVRGERPPRLGNRDAAHAPRGNYRCAGDDQWLTLTVESDAQWRALRELVGDASLRDPALERLEERQRRHAAIDAALAAWACTRERDALVEALAARGIPAAGVLDVNEVLAHPQLEARGFWQWIEREVVGVQPTPSAPHRTSDAPHAIEWPAPTLGQHSREVLRGLLRLADAELDALERAGVIGSAPDFARAASSS
jgi:crotonobetainyl-CoA:carnitine CoA-transferase CaiB-like acyl-CoA transferase